MPRHHVRVRELTDADRRTILGWRYAGRDATYDPGADDATLDAGFVALTDIGGSLVGYACFGPEARVPGLDQDETTVDVGAGVRPDLVGGGWGGAVAEAALGEARERHPDATHARAVVLEWNDRSRRTLRSAGFIEVGTHRTEDGRAFVVATRPLS